MYQESLKLSPHKIPIKRLSILDNYWKINRISEKYDI